MLGAYCAAINEGRYYFPALLLLVLRTTKDRPTKAVRDKIRRKVHVT